MAFCQGRVLSGLSCARARMLRLGSPGGGLGPGCSGCHPPTVQHGCHAVSDATPGHRAVSLEMPALPFSQEAHTFTENSRNC